MEPHREGKRSFLNEFSDQELGWDEYWFRSHDISMSGFRSRSVVLEDRQVQPRFKLLCYFFFFLEGNTLVCFTVGLVWVQLSVRLNSVGGVGQGSTEFLLFRGRVAGH